MDGGGESAQHAAFLLLAEYPQRPESQSFARHFRASQRLLSVNSGRGLGLGYDSSSEFDESGYVAPPPRAKYITTTHSPGTPHAKRA